MSRATDCAGRGPGVAEVVPGLLQLLLPRHPLLRHLVPLLGAPQRRVVAGPPEGHQHLAQQGQPEVATGAGHPPHLPRLPGEDVEEGGPGRGPPVLPESAGDDDVVAEEVAGVADPGVEEVGPGGPGGGGQVEAPHLVPRVVGADHHHLAARRRHAAAVKQAEWEAGPGGPLGGARGEEGGGVAGAGRGAAQDEAALRQGHRGGVVPAGVEGGVAAPAVPRLQQVAAGAAAPPAGQHPGGGQEGGVAGGGGGQGRGGAGGAQQLRGGELPVVV